MVPTQGQPDRIPVRRDCHSVLNSEKVAVVAAMSLWAERILEEIDG